jgi:multimeric flavodoxin WrbA
MKRIPVLCIAGSPRRGGNTDALLDAFSEGVVSGGAYPVRLIASELGIEGCRGCGGCSETGRCVLRDGMDEVYRLLDEAAAVVVSTPVFFATVPADLKALYDRCQPYWARRYLLGEARPVVPRPGVALIVGAGGDPFGTSCALAPTQSVFAVLGVSLIDRIEIVGPDGPHEVRGDEDLLARAVRSGVATAEKAAAAGR